MKKLTFILLLSTAAAAQAGLSSPPDAVPPQTSATQQQAEEPGVRKAKRLVEQMIQALGGQAYLNIQDMEFSGRTYGFYQGEPQGAGAPFWDFWKWPDKERVELTKQRDWVIIYNGDKGTEVTFRGPSPVEQETLDDYLRRRHYSLQNVLRVWLKQPGIAYFYEGVASAERRPAEQVTILNAQNEGVTLFIDQNTFLPIKKSFTWREPKTRDRNDEAEVYDNYRDVQGIKTPFSITRQKNGLNTNQRFLNQVTYNQNLPDSLFNPEAALSPQRK